MLITVDFTFPIANPLLSVHLLHTRDKLVLDGAPNMELLATGRDVALYTLTILLFADKTSQPKFLKIYCSTIVLKLGVALLKPNLIHPIHTDNMDPLFRFEPHYSTLLIRTQKALWGCLMLVLKQVVAAFTVPGRFIIEFLLVKVFPIATGVYYNIAQIANSERVIFLVESGATDITSPIIFELVGLNYDFWVFSTD
jgi:hypothetical protein